MYCRRKSCTNGEEPGGAWRFVLTDQIELFGSEMELPLEACLPREMDEKYREILVLRFEELLDYREIAERLHISAALCRQRVSRAKAYYRKWLKGRK